MEIATHTGLLEQSADGRWWAWVELGDHLPNGSGETQEEAKESLRECIQVFRDFYSEEGKPVPAVLNEEISSFEVGVFDDDGERIG
jgi:predicted RNase H-like HicB family nuclease